MNKIALIIPYYGSYPNYISLWVQSIRNNPDIDFLLFSDKSPIDGELPSNLIWHNITFNEMVEMFQKKFDFPIKLSGPYKFCDFKPSYGYVLKEFLKGYEFWGHCDPDIIWGRFDHYLTNEILNNYDRIYTRGHLAIYRNNEEMNSLFMINHNFRDCYYYKYVFSTDYGCAFDEWGTKYGFGVSEIFKRLNVRTYNKIDFADIAYNKYKFTLAVSNEEISPELFFYSLGGLFGFAKTNGELKKQEFLYVHLQKRDMEFAENWTEETKNNFFIIPNQFLPYNKDLEKILSAIIYPKFYFAWYPKRIKRFFSKIRSGALQQLVYRKLCIHGIIKYRG